MKIRTLSLILCALPLLAFASEAPPGQRHLQNGDVLRGHFVEEKKMPGVDTPLISTGHFTLAPAYGLLWGMEQPLTTTTIVTPNGVAQDIGGMALKMKARNLRHLYEMVGGALQGDWNGLDQEFIIRRGNSANGWQMLLTPRPDNPNTTGYISIAVTGSAFVQTISLNKADGGYDAFHFSDEHLTTGPLAAGENALFAEVTNR